MKRRLLGLAVAFGLVGCGAPAASPPPCPTQAPTAAEAQQILTDASRAVVKTNKGEFSIELDTDAAPIATANFVALARCDFYDGISFHRVIAGFLIQAGDPQTRTNHGDFQDLGSGGPGYKFAVESPPDELMYDQYVVAMANAEPRVPDSNGSQFFIDLIDLDEVPTWQRNYTILGKVASGTDVVDAIGQLPTNERDVPLDPAIIESLEIQGAAAP